MEFFHRKTEKNLFSKLNSTAAGAKRLRISGRICPSSFNCDSVEVSILSASQLWPHKAGTQGQDFVLYFLVSTTCVACFVGSCSVTENPSACRSIPVRSASP